MRIGIVGYGVVGKAVTEGFRSLGFEVYVNDICSDRNFNSKRSLVDNCDLIFICVPTPNNRDGTMNILPLIEVIQVFLDISNEAVVPPLIIKSTVLPNTCKNLNKIYNPKLKFSSNPEFITEKNATTDFLNADRTIIASDYPETLELLRDIYATFKNVNITDTTTAELAKYLSNIFLVNKVAFAVEMGKIANIYNVNSEDLGRLVGSDRRIGLSHMNPKYGKIPKNSPCLPKDIKAFNSELRNKRACSCLFTAVENVGIEEK